MSVVRTVRISIGLAAWLAAVAGLVVLLLADRGDGGGTVPRLSSFLTSQTRTVDVQLNQFVLMELGDEVQNEATGEMIGDVVGLLDRNGEILDGPYDYARRARLRLFDTPGAELYADASGRLILVPEAFVWVVDTLLTEENLPLIANAWNETMLEHREEIFTRLTPIVVDVIRDVEATLAETLPRFTAHHREDLRRISRRLEERLSKEELAQLFEEEVWPVGEAELRPIAREIGQEIWEKVPLWGFTWRVVWQSLPLTRDDHFQRKWQEFVRKEIDPIVRERLDDIVDASKRVGARVMRSERVQDHLRDAVLELAELPEFHRLVQAFIKEAFLDNPKFHERMLVRVESPEVDGALSAASARIEPTLRKIGDLVLGTRDEGITDEFARVLKTQILQRDRRRFVLRAGSEAAGAHEPGAAVPVRVEWEGPRRAVR